MSHTIYIYKETQVMCLVSENNRIALFVFRPCFGPVVGQLEDISWQGAP